MKRVQWRRITWKLCSMSRLDVVSCRWRIYWTGSSMAHLTSQDTVCPSRSFWSLWWPWYWQLMAITPIFHFKREPFSHNISCSRTQFSITTAYGILSIRPFRALCWTSATAILHRVSWPLESNRRLLFRRVRYCESEERGGRAEQHVSDKYSECLTPIASSVTWLHSPPSQITRYCPSDPCHTAPTHDPACIKRKTGRMTGETLRKTSAAEVLGHNSN